VIGQARALGLITFAIALSACGASSRDAARPAPKSVARADADAGAPATPASLGPEVPSVEVLASRGPSDAPQMREVLRVSDASKLPAEIKAATSDVCVRAIVASSAPVRAWLEDEAHAPRGEVAVAGGAGATSLVPPRGPACTRRGEVLRLVVEPTSSTTTHAVIWQSP